MAKDSSRISCKRPRPPIRAESGKYQLGVLTKTYPHCCEIGGTWGGIGLGDIHLESNQNTVYIYIKIKNQGISVDPWDMIDRDCESISSTQKKYPYPHLSESKGRERSFPTRFAPRQWKENFHLWWMMLMSLRSTQHHFGRAIYSKIHRVWYTTLGGLLCHQQYQCAIEAFANDIHGFLWMIGRSAIWHLLILHING